MVLTVQRSRNISVLVSTGALMQPTGLNSRRVFAHGPGGWTSKRGSHQLCFPQGLSLGLAHGLLLPVFTCGHPSVPVCVLISSS